MSTGAGTLPPLFDYEIEVICSALRRDMRREEELAKARDGYEHEHFYNAREAKRLLELFHPKQPQHSSILRQQQAA